MRDEQGQKCPVVVEGRESDDWVVVHLGEDGATPPLGDTAMRVQTVFIVAFVVPRFTELLSSKI